MKVLHRSDSLLFEKGTAVALGNFDGLHTGHKKLIDEICFVSKKFDIPSVVFTFDKHPHNILKHTKTVKCITTNGEKIKLLEDMGVDYTYFEDFEAVMDYSPERFVDEIIVKKFNASYVVCGFNYSFGAGGRGDTAVLSELLKARGIKLTVINPIIIGDTLVSSTYIRGLIEDGNMEAASLFLGREFFIDFPVREGRKLGRTMNIPTINQHFPENHIIPARGVYACRCFVDGDSYIGVSNVGVKPTVTNENTELCETHILDFCGDLYGRKIRVDFFKKLRDEKKFDSVEILKSEIKKDIEAARSYFNINY